MSDNLNTFSKQVVEILPVFFREFAQREDNELTRGKISFPQMVALDFAARRPRATMTALADVLSIRMSSATVLIDRLVRQRMLERRRDEKDRRVVWVSATAKGRRVIAQIMDQKRRSVKDIFRHLTARERAHYLHALLKVNAYLKCKS